MKIKTGAIIFLLSALMFAACSEDEGTEDATKKKTYVAVGQEGVIMLSDNGLNWIRVESPVSSTLYGAAWNGRYFCAAGQDAAIVRSPDGINWTVVTTTSTANTLSDIETFNGTFCAVGYDGVIITSEDDGETWINVANPAVTTSIYEICRTGSYWYAGGAEGKMLRSENAVSWSQIASPTGVGIMCLSARGNDLIMIDINNYVYLSENNGSSFTAHNIDKPFFLATAIASNGSNIVLNGFENVAGGRIYTSIDIANWTLAWEDTNDRHLALDLIWDDNRFIGAGAYGSLVISNADASVWNYYNMAITEDIEAIIMK
ncbi:MAG: hypothetical protein JW864_15020 [Spirochaetes bacterium]|nr:hypothetical protein [Spirochaetota bacterium]